MHRLLTFLAIVTLGAVAANGANVPRWQIHDFAFKSGSAPSKPFEVDFSAEVTTPDGLRFTQLGFYDGDGTWKIRLGPNQPGIWKIRTVSTQPELSGKTGSIGCIEQSNPRVHGGLLVDPLHPHHFVREDGTRFFYAGFECDWLWALDLATCDPALPQTIILLNKLVANNFNVIYLNLYAHSYGNSLKAPSFSPPAKFPWGGSNDRPDHSTLNLPFWQHFDRVMQALWERGLEAHLMIKVYNKHVNWPTPGSEEDDRFFNYVIARYAPFSNVHWDFAKESNRETNLVYKLNRLALIRESDPYRRLLTTHTDSQSYSNYVGVLDYRTAQKHRDWHSSTVHLLQREPWPVVDAEYGYECGPAGINDTPGPKCEDARTLCQRAWETYTAGAYGAYYYAYTSWTVVRVNDTPPGYGYCSNLARFFAPIGLWTMTSRDDLVDAGYCLANPGVEYAVYQPEGKPFTLRIAQAKKPLSAEWFNPLTGARITAKSLDKGNCQLTPPAAWGTNPVALHVGAAPPYTPVFRNTLTRALPTKSPGATQ